MCRQQAGEERASGSGCRKGSSRSWECKVEPGWRRTVADSRSGMDNGEKRSHMEIEATIARPNGKTRSEAREVGSSRPRGVWIGSRAE